MSGFRAMKLFKATLLKIPLGQREFTLTFGWFVLVITLLPVLLKLGVWQLERAAQRQKARDDLQLVMTQAPVALDQASLGVKETMVRVTVAGELDWSKQFLLDNQVHNTMPGYEVLVPLNYAPNKAVLVSRGWLPETPGKKPDLSPPSGVAAKQEVQGLAVIPKARLSDYQRNIVRQSKDYKELNPKPELADWPVLIQEEDFAALSSLLQTRLLPRVIQPQSDLAFGYRRVWQPSLRGPAVNYGYAAQWFGMALLLLGMMVWLNTRHQDQVATAQ